MLIAKESTYASLSSFTDIALLNEAIRNHRSTHALSPTELSVLDVLSRHSCRTLGVSFLTKNSIAKHIDKSRRTVIRACNRLESLGIIVQHSVKRASDMQQTSNAIVIQAEVTQPVAEPTDTAEDTTLVTQDVSHQEALSPCKQSPTVVIDTAYVYSDALKNSLPTDIWSAFSSYFGAEDIYKYYGALLRAKRKTSKTLLIEHNPVPFTDAIHAVALKIKQGKIGDITSYFYTSFVSATKEAMGTLADYSTYYDWLTD